MTQETVNERYWNARREGTWPIIRVLDGMADHAAMNDEVFLDFVTLISTPEFSRNDSLEAHLAFSSVLERLVRGFARARTLTERESMVLEAWQHSASYSPQLATSLMLDCLRTHPEDPRALHEYLEATIGRDYRPRGESLESIAFACPAPASGTFTGYQAAIDVLLGWAEFFQGMLSASQIEEGLLAARARVERAKALNPALDMEAVVARCRGHWGWNLQIDDLEPHWMDWYRNLSV